MFTNKKIAPYIFAFLVFCVVSSKHIVIYNEEILVALSFLFFIIFVSYYFGNTIKESLDERSSAILSEFQNFLTLKKDCLNELFKEYKKAFLFKQIFQNVADFTKLQLENKSKNYEKALKKIFSQQIIQKLKSFSYANLDLTFKLQQIMSNQLLTAVLVKSKKLKTKNNTQNKLKLNFSFLKQKLQILAK